MKKICDFFHDKKKVLSLDTETNFNERNRCRIGRFELLCEGI